MLKSIRNGKIAIILTFAMLLAAIAPVGMATLALTDISPAGSDMRTSVSQHGVTWYFDRPVQAGQFVTGDWWVVGPVTITRITPETEVVDFNITVWDGTQNVQRSIQRRINGSMINPQIERNAQGFDSNLGQHHGQLNMYFDNLNVALNLPRTFDAGTSLLSSISNLTRGGNPQSVPQLEVIAILTVLDAPAPVGTFRPPYIGTDRPMRWNVDDLDFTKLRNLPAPPNTVVPDIHWVTELFELPRIEINTIWNGRNLRPFMNSRSLINGIGAYGRESSNLSAVAMLLLNMDFTDAEKELLLIRMVQYGIDIYGVTSIGGSWPSDGGHNMGRKMPLILTAYVLDDDSMMRFADAENYFIFQEDQSTFWVSQQDVDLNAARQELVARDGRRRDDYTVDMIGMPEWGDKNSEQPVRNGSNWCIAYRQLAGAAFLGQVLVAHIMDMTEVWNWEPLFEYSDRFVSELHQMANETEPRNELQRVGTHTNAILPFIARMWEAYRYDSSIGGPDEPIVNLPDPIFLDISQRSLGVNDFVDGNHYIITGSTTTNTITVPATFTSGRITLRDVSIVLSAAPAANTGPLVLQPGAKVDLTFEGNNVLRFNGWIGTVGGIHVPNGAELTISSVDGRDVHALTIEGGNNRAGIYSGGTVTINSGTITALGKNGAGIGGNVGTPNGTVIINGGNVTATAGGSSAGIGGGGNVTAAVNGAGGNILITGGVVVANGGANGAGIGGAGGRNGAAAGDSGSGGAGGNIIITGGRVTASSPRGAAIGGGAGSDNANATSPQVNGGAAGNITITGGAVTANVTNATATSAGIGGGGAGRHAGGLGTAANGGNVTITDGIVTISNAGSGLGVGGGAQASTLAAIAITPAVIMRGNSTVGAAESVFVP